MPTAPETHVDPTFRHAIAAARDNFRDALFRQHLSDVAVAEVLGSFDEAVVLVTSAVVAENNRQTHLLRSARASLSHSPEGANFAWSST